MQTPVIRPLSIVLAAFTVLSASAVVPEVSGVSMTQDSSRLVTITYTLADAPAVITIDVQTNYLDGAETKWASIGGEVICTAQGDVWKKVAAGAHTITWRPDMFWPDHKIPDGGARAVVTAWPLDNPPDYMVVDISAAAQPNTQRYYPSADFIPGGIVANDEYRKTSIAMRKIMVKGVTWTMGSTPAESQRASDEATHKVTLDDNYYIGVFEVTQQQLALIKPGRQTGYFYTATDWQMRPCEQHSYIEIRDGDSQSTSVSSYPSAPASGSYLDLLRSKTGIAFDLPSEAQWEFAARAGHGSGLYGDDSAILNKNNTSYNASNLDANLGRIARYKWNCAWGMNGADCGSTSARAEVSTAICGSYAPNDWGLYDIIGNVAEWCLDWYASDISSLNGAVNTTAGSARVFRGGSWRSIDSECRPARRASAAPNTRVWYTGFRLACPAAQN